MGKESIVEIPEGSGNQYRYVYEDGKTLYKGPVGDAPELTEEGFNRIFISKNYIAAQEVVDVVEKLAAQTWGEGDIDIGHFHNGREHGFSFRYMPPDGSYKVAFVTQHRTSDELRVTIHGGVENDWKEITEKEYDDSRFFKEDEAHKAAEYIFKELRLR